MTSRALEAQTVRQAVAKLQFLLLGDLQPYRAETLVEAMKTVIQDEPLMDYFMRMMTYMAEGNKREFQVSLLRLLVRAAEIAERLDK